MRRFVEALAAGRLNAKMVPEIEEAFRDLGAGRRSALQRGAAGVRAFSRKKGKAHFRGRGRKIPQVPDPFTWQDVADLWGLSRTKAFKLIKTFKGDGLIQVRIPGKRAGYTKHQDAQPKSQDAQPKSQDAKKAPKPRPDAQPKSQDAKTEISAAQSLIIETYSEKSFVVRGDTKPFKDQLGRKGLGGKWNRKLRDGIHAATRSRSSSRKIHAAPRK